MIFFGSKGKIVPGEAAGGIQCPDCENQQFITFGIIRYFHLYWIPTFPTSKKVGIECTHCKRTLMGKEIPADLSKLIKTTVFNKKNLIPMFSGLIIIACFVLFVTYAVLRDIRQEAASIENPAENDVYVANFSKIFTDVDTKQKYGALKFET